MALAGPPGLHLPTPICCCQLTNKSFGAKRAEQAHCKLADAPVCLCPWWLLLQTNKSLESERAFARKLGQQAAQTKEELQVRACLLQFNH